jgi:hypothetical protein
MGLKDNYIKKNNLAFRITEFAFVTMMVFDSSQSFNVYKWNPRV